MKRLSKGYTLIELIVSMTIISVALLGTLSAINTTGLYSADPLLNKQAVLIAQSYLEEILSKNFYLAACPAGTRATYTNICNYNGLVEVPTDQTGTAISGLGAYTVTVSVDAATASLGSPTLTAGTQVARVDVSVAHNRMTTLKLTGYRTYY